MEVLQNKKVIKRGRGRPPARSEEETRRLVIEAAAAEFQANGYATAGVDKIAERAGLSTRTIYQLGNKAELFEMVIADRAGRFIPAMNDHELNQLEPVQALTRILASFGRLTLSAETIAMSRLVIAEGVRFPELAKAFNEKAVLRISNVMEAWFVYQAGRGHIALDDPHAAVGMLRGMMLMEPQHAVFWGQRDVPTEAEIDARAKACAELFLKGCLA